MQSEPKRLLAHLVSRPELLRQFDLVGPGGRSDARQADKLEEVAGFCAVILRYVRQCFDKAERLRVLEPSCGKSYVGFVLATLLREFENKETELVGVDSDAELIDRCRALATAAGFEDTEFVCTRTERYETERSFDLVVSLHACDTATDQAIAAGIRLGAQVILVVPCCQNQIRGQIKSGHPLSMMTEFGPARYRLANLLTDTLRAQFLRAAGYHVEMDEIGSPRLTPKNLCIGARKVKRRIKTRRDVEYRALRDLFGVRPKIERYCPDVIRDDDEPAGAP